MGARAYGVVVIFDQHWGNGGLFNWEGEPEGALEKVKNKHLYIQ
jgi:hypothetical protein